MCRAGIKINRKLVQTLDQPFQTWLQSSSARLSGNVLLAAALLKVHLFSARGLEMVVHPQGELVVDLTGYAQHTKKPALHISNGASLSILDTQLEPGSDISDSWHCRAGLALAAVGSTVGPRAGLAQLRSSTLNSHVAGKNKSNKRQQTKDFWRGVV